jgi:hypothetical protein
MDEIIGGLIPTGVPNRFYDAVPIVPNAAEIAAASRVLESTGVAADTICTICQEHDSPRDISGTVNPSNGWRLLTNCTHTFHKDCIDRWFEAHAVCPICRADIRVRPALAP